MAAQDPVSGDPIVSFNFSLSIDGITDGAYFTEASGIGSENEIIEHKVMGPNGKEVIRKIPGRLKWGDITLKRGLTANMKLWEWRKMVEDGNVDAARKNGSIIMYDQAGTEMARWNIERAWPASLTGPSVSADSNAVGIEEIKICHEYIERASV